MVTEPVRYVKEFAKCGADIITVHLEACKDPAATLDEIHDCGVKAGISIKPGTRVKELEPYLDQAEMFLIMSVEPGIRRTGIYTGVFGADPAAEGDA